MRRLILASISGEIVLKSDRTRPRFEKRLLANLEDALKSNNVNYSSTWIEQARLYIDTEDPKALRVCSRVFGIHWATLAEEIRFKGLEDLAEETAKIASSWVKGRRFAVRARRAGHHDFTSMDVARIVGSKLLPYSNGVDLDEPEVEVHVEVRGDKAYIYKDLVRGPDGLPIGVEGRAIVLFSGGLDSPVAAWYTAKRGVEVDFLHMILATEESAKDAEDVAKILASEWLYGYRPRLLVADFRYVVGLIAAKVRPEYRQVVLRVAMYSYAERLAEKEGYNAIVTGESLGQVSSQTLRNLEAITIVAKITKPILRPLIGFDKEEIVEKARAIGTYERSSKTREYCRLGAEAATTRASPKILEKEYSKIADALDHVELVSVKALR
ncbi:MAG: tRNA uracil 4-sulfurtransferase ThiI [Pyrodictiaceae archaeon]